MSLLSCSDIRFQYPGAENVLFDGLTFSIARPGFHALFGPSGIGKTTLAKIISGDIGPLSGQVEATGEAPCLYTYNRERLPGWSSVGRHIEKSTPMGRESLRDDLIRQIWPFLAYGDEIFHSFYGSVQQGKPVAISVTGFWASDNG
jgi:ABC-type nitrate/sulfonate/bicarbonate transport system ATPase subunit